MIRRSILLGTGSALPKRVVTNAELAETVDTSDEWIVERTGIRARHIAGEGETTATLATDAARAALEAAGYRPTRALQRLRAIPFLDAQAALLDVPSGHAGLLIERRAFLADGRPAEVTQSYYRGDAYDFVAELGE